MQVELEEVEKYLRDGLWESKSPWANETSRQLAYVFDAYIRNRIEEYKQRNNSSPKAG